MRGTKSQSLATAVCIAIALQLFSVTANAVAVGAPSKLMRSERRSSGSARALAEAIVAPANGQTPPNPMDDEDQYAEYIADKIIAFCESISKLPSQTLKLSGQQRVAEAFTMERCVEQLMEALNNQEDIELPGGRTR